MPQQQRDATRIATTFDWTCSTDPTDVPYQGDEAQNVRYANHQLGIDRSFLQIL